MSKKTIVRPDSKGRISLGKYAKGVSGFHMRLERHGYLVLEPYVEVPAKEEWLHINKQAHNQVKRGIRQSAEGKLHDLGKFANYINDDTE